MRNNAPLKDRALRAEYDQQAMSLVEKFQADVILLAGYVWATTDIVLDQYVIVNVHPADLAVLKEDGTRQLAGANGIKAAFVIVNVILSSLFMIVITFHSI